MHRTALIFAVAGWLIFTAVGAEQEPAAGKLLVATEGLRGGFFARTVVLLLRYDDTGAVGLIVNRPAGASPAELLSKDEAPVDYRGTLYWGGPVGMDTVRALQLTDAPPDGAMPIVDTVHQVPIDAALSVEGADSATLRFFVGYAGWAPGQLERELALGSWHVVPAAEELIFTDDPEMIWKRLTPVREYRANKYRQVPGQVPGHPRYPGGQVPGHPRYPGQVAGHPRYPPGSISPAASQYGQHEQHEDTHHKVPPRRSASSPAAVPGFFVAHCACLRPSQREEPCERRFLPCCFLEWPHSRKSLPSICCALL